ncbi:unnamed protein product [Toxocara canis]|uniref:Uncharacterized protein n=1 Tax=Toxocara canis TaxID=6265 RepID=A0A183UKD2_TOXCA|nr:unnamed protein product [Toxocara canis]
MPTKGTTTPYHTSAQQTHRAPTDGCVCAELYGAALQWMLVDTRCVHAVCGYVRMSCVSRYDHMIIMPSCLCASNKLFVAARRETAATYLNTKALKNCFPEQRTCTDALHPLQAPLRAQLSK